jgi:hypothetical protein
MPLRPSCRFIQNLGNIHSENFVRFDVPADLNFSSVVWNCALKRCGQLVEGNASLLDPDRPARTVYDEQFKMISSTILIESKQA